MTTSQPSRYILATGERDVERLRILQEIYGPTSEALLRRVGLRPGMRVVEIGCGDGNMTCWMAEQVGPAGSVVGVDGSAAQVEQARRQAEARSLSNVTFVVADACSPGLPPGSFDLAYCRLVLMHLARSRDSLRAMRDLIGPGGVVVCEEMDLTHWLCDPPSPALTRFMELSVVLGDRLGEHFRLGGSLHRLFREAGLDRPEVAAVFPVVLRGEHKRLYPLTFDEYAPLLVREGLASQAEAEAMSAEVWRLAEDETTLFGYPLMGQVWARKEAGPAAADA
jgi:SAM-dependent methyltransferase